MIGIHNALPSIQTKRDIVLHLISGNYHLARALEVFGNLHQHETAGVHACYIRYSMKKASDPEDQGIHSFIPWGNHAVLLVSPFCMVRQRCRTEQNRTE